jgi:hypothetical protein
MREFPPTTNPNIQGWTRYKTVASALSILLGTITHISPFSIFQSCHPSAEIMIQNGHFWPGSMDLKIDPTPGFVWAVPGFPRICQAVPSLSQ